MDPGQLRQLRGPASVLALHLLRLRVQADVVRRASADRLRAVLRAPLPAGEDLGLGLPPGPWRVVALGAVGHDGAGELVPDRALWESIFRRHGWRQPLLTDIGEMLFAVVTAEGDRPGTWPWLERLIQDVAVDDPGVRAASGGLARTPEELPRSRAESAELLALRRTIGSVDPLLRFEQAWAEVVVHRAVGAVSAPDLLIGGPLPALVEHDRRYGTAYVDTVAAWLDQQGDPRRAARQLHVHPNTLRYRMRRLAEVAPVDLGSARVRLALQLQLATLRHGDPDQGDCGGVLTHP